jgi:hypothetical protein
MKELLGYAGRSRAVLRDLAASTVSNFNAFFFFRSNMNIIMMNFV